MLDGIRVPLLGPQGIFKPQILTGAPRSLPLLEGHMTIRSARIIFCDTDIEALTPITLIIGVCALQWNAVCHLSIFMA
jgi:hypothetical protein